MTDHRKPTPLSCHLPYDARAALARASQTPITTTDPLARVKAIDAAMAQARARFPKLFSW